jgi:hypothetical protein
MTTLMAPPSMAYTLAQDLCEPAALANIHRSAPDEWAREDLLLLKLGARGWGRVHHFRNYYASGWGEQGGKPLSPNALSAFFKFLESITFPASTAPSVFLTDQGGIELCWEDESGKSVQVEFTRAGAEFFRESTGDEGTVPHSATSTLCRQLTS